MKIRKLWLAGGLLPVAVVVALALNGKDEEATFRKVAIERGSVEEIVSATGTLQATETVEVGTQVSGQIAEILVDFNARVKKGQLLARIDPTILNNEVRAAEASVARSRAELDQSEREYERSKALYAEKVVTASEFEQTQYGRSVAAASHAQATVSLERARRNLGYTEIRAPIDGIVVERAVDGGQTVAASTSAPKLFLLAQDLSQMEILASVDESDIGKIEEGQPVRFTVQAFGEREFEGKVRQVRLQSTAADNVVSYGVVVSVENPNGKLLPGMTATLSFQVSRAENVLKVANAALRFQPTAEMREALGPEVKPNSGVARPVPAGSALPRDASRTEAAAQRIGGTRRSKLWLVDATGQYKTVAVRTGLSDGQFTEISGEGIEEAMEVIAGVSSGGGNAAPAANPFQNQQRSGAQGGPGGPPRGF